MGKHGEEDMKKLIQQLSILWTIFAHAVLWCADSRIFFVIYQFYNVM